MKIICSFHKLLFFISTELYTLITKIWKKKQLKLMKVNTKKYHQHRIKSETGISPEIILNVFKCLAV